MKYRKKKKRRFFRRSPKGKKNASRFQTPMARFPRLLRYPRVQRGHEDDIQILPLLRQMREEYPAPYYDSWRDGSFNPPERVISYAVGLTIAKLKERCLYHGMSGEGTRFQMVKRIYLHYRSRRLELGYPFVAYGVDHENVNPQQCDCGKVYKKIKRFPRLKIMRFPRLAVVYDMGQLRFTDPKRYKQLMQVLGWAK